MGPGDNFHIKSMNWPFGRRFCNLRGAVQLTQGFEAQKTGPEMQLQSSLIRKILKLFLILCP